MIDFEVDWFREVGEKGLDVGSGCGRLSGGNVDVRVKNATLASLGGSIEITKIYSKQLDVFSGLNVPSESSILGRSKTPCASLSK